MALKELPLSGLVAYVSVLQSKTKEPFVGIHAYSYEEFTGKAIPTAFPRYSFSPLGYMLKQDLKDAGRNALEILDLSFSMNKDLSKEDQVTFIIERLRTITKQPITVISKVFTLTCFAEHEAVYYLRPKADSKVLGIDLSDINSEIAYRTLDPTLPWDQSAILTYPPAEYYKEKATRPSTYMLNKTILHRELDSAFVYMVNCKKVEEIGKTYPDITYAVIKTENKEITHPKELEIFRKNYSEETPNVLVVENLPSFSPRIQNMLGRRGTDALYVQHDEVRIVSGLVPLAYTVSNPLLLMRGLDYLNELKNRIDDPSAVLTDITERMGSVTQASKKVTVKVEDGKVGLLVGHSLPTYIYLRKMLKENCKIYVQSLKVDGYTYFNVLIKNEDFTIILAAPSTERAPF